MQNKNASINFAGIVTNLTVVQTLVLMKTLLLRFCLFSCLLGLGTLGSAQTLSIASLSPAGPYCDGQTVTVNIGTSLASVTALPVTLDLLNNNGTIKTANYSSGSILATLLTGSLTFVAPNPGTYKIAISTATAGYTKDTSISFTVTNKPDVTATPNQFFCANVGSSVLFTSANPATTFEWTNDEPTIGLSASGTGNISFTSSNNGTAPISANIKVTPKVPGCSNGSSDNFTIKISPVAIISGITNPDQIVCSGASVSNINFSTTATNGSTSFDWVASNNAGTGLNATGSGNISSFSAATNNSTTPQVSTITVTPNYAISGGSITCPGTPATTSLTVNPKAVVSPITNPNQIVCSGAPVAMIGFATTATGGATTFAWTATNMAGTGIGASGNGDITGFTANANNGTAPQVSNGTVTPAFTNTSGGPTCSGTPANFTVSVNPKVVVGVISNQDQIVCSGGTAGPINFSSTVTGGTVTFDWSATNNAATGLTATGSGNIGTFTAAANNGTAPQVSNGTVTPSYVNAGGGPTCAGTAGSFSLRVNPQVVVDVINQNQIVCSGGAISFIAFDSKAVGGNVTFNWTVTNAAGTGIPASGNSGIIAGRLSTANAGTAPQVSYGTVTPYYANIQGGPGCAGTANSFSVTVNPVPTVASITNQNQIVCSAAPVAAITFNPSATGGTTTFNWTATNAAGTSIAAIGSGATISGFTANSNTGTAP